MIVNPPAEVLPRVQSISTDGEQFRLIKAMTYDHVTDIYTCKYFSVHCLISTTKTLVMLSDEIIEGVSFS